MPFELSQIDYPAFYEGTERFMRQNFHPLMDPRVAMMGRINDWWHAGEEKIFDRELFLERMRKRAEQEEANRPTNRSKPQYQVESGMEALVVIPEEGDEVTKLYNKWQGHGGVPRISKFVMNGIIGNGPTDKAASLEHMKRLGNEQYFCGLRVGHSPNSTFSEARLNFDWASLWPVTAKCRIEDHERFLVVHQEKLPERATLKEVMETVEQNRGLALYPYSAECTMLVHEQRTQSMLFFTETHSGNFRKSRNGIVKLVDVECYRLEPEDFSLCFEIRACAWKLKERLEQRGMDPALPEEIERIIRRDPRSKEEEWPTLRLDKSSMHVTSDEMYREKAFYWR